MNNVLSHYRLLAHLVTQTFLLASVLAMVVTTAHAQERWALGSRAESTIGALNGNEFGEIVGGTRLGDGSIVIAERGEFALRVFDRSGKQRSQVGRRGNGPGEVASVLAFHRCGKELIVQAMDGRRLVVFDTTLVFVTNRRLWSPASSGAAYRSTCDNDGTFVSVGYERGQRSQPGLYHPHVSLWLSAPAQDTGRLLATVPGDQRFVVEGGPFAKMSAPVPLGRQTFAAIRGGVVVVVTGSADSISLWQGAKATPTIHKIVVGNAATTPAIVDAAIALALESVPPDAHTQFEQMLRSSAPIPKTVPPIRRVIAGDNVRFWIEGAQVAAGRETIWSAIDNSGKRVAELLVPANVTPLEIGQDYLLGRYTNPDDGSHEVRVYAKRKVS